MKSNIKNTVKVGDILTVKPEEQVWISKGVKWELAEVVKVYKTADKANDEVRPSGWELEDGDHFPLFRVENPRTGELNIYSHRFFVDIASTIVFTNEEKYKG